MIDGGDQPIISYDANGNLTRYKDWTYTYDAQNRLTSATGSGHSAVFYYDGKNRQIARKIDNVVIRCAWDNWELVEEYASGLSPATSYLQGATGVIKSWGSNGVFYYYQDKLGSTTQVANASGALLESYRYDLYGTPSYYRDDMKYDSSIYGISDLYAGERWASELSLYDLRNRFMSPELGRFLQTDPIGFKGDASNLYRYCGNDPVDKTDPMGLEAAIGSTIAERMRLFYGDGGRGNLWELDHPKDASLTMATLPRNDSLTHGMHFVPTRLSEDGKTAYPTTSDHTGGRYEYQLTKDGKRESGRGYTVLEKLSPVPGVVNNVDAKIKQEKWRPLQSNGIFPDAVGIGFRPSHSVNKVSVVYQTFELKYNNQPVSVSTRFIHDVRYDPSGQLRVSVLVDRP